MLPQPQSQPCFLPARSERREEGWERHPHKHHFTFLSASELKPSQPSTDHAHSHHKAEGAWDSTASKDYPLCQYRPHGSSFLLWGCCKSTLCPGGIRLQRFHCKKCLKEEIVFHFLSRTALWNRYCFPGQWCPVLTPPKWQEKHLGSRSYLTHRAAWRTI